MGSHHLLRDLLPSVVMGSTVCQGCRVNFNQSSILEGLHYSPATSPKNSCRKR